MNFEMVTLRNNRDSGNPVSVYNTSDAYGKTVLFEEAEDRTDGFFSMDIEALLQGLHDLGFDVQGWKPKKTLHDAVTELLASTVAMGQTERAKHVIELIQGYES